MNPLMELIEEIYENYEEDREIETKILEDLIHNIQVELYERTHIIDTLADMWENDDG